MSEDQKKTPYLLRGPLGHFVVIPFLVQVGVVGLVDEMVSSMATLIFAQLAVFGTSYIAGTMKRSAGLSILVGFWPAMAFVVLRLYDRLDVYSPQRPMTRLAGYEYWLAAYAALTLAVAAAGWAVARAKRGKGEN